MTKGECFENPSIHSNISALSVTKPTKQCVAKGARKFQNSAFEHLDDFKLPFFHVGTKFSFELVHVVYHDIIYHGQFLFYRVKTSLS